MGLISKAVELPVQPLVVRALPAREGRASGVASGLTPAAVRADPYQTGRQPRSTDPDCRRRLADAWALTRCRHIEAVPRDHQRFGSAGRILGETVPLSLLDPDAPEHTRPRSPVAKAFTPRAVATLRPHIEEIAGGLLDAAAGQDQSDLAGAPAYPLTVTSIAELPASGPATWTDSRSGPMRWLSAPTRSSPAVREVASRTPLRKQVRTGRRSSTNGAAGHARVRSARRAAAIRQPGPAQRPGRARGRRAWRQAHRSGRRGDLRDRGSEPGAGGVRASRRVGLRASGKAIIIFDTRAGATLACNGSRRATGRDADQIELLPRRSFDGGRTLGQVRTVVSLGYDDFSINRSTDQPNAA